MYHGLSMFLRAEYVKSCYRFRGFTLISTWSVVRYILLRRRQRSQPSNPSNCFIMLRFSTLVHQNGPIGCIMDYESERHRVQTWSRSLSFESDWRALTTDSTSEIIDETPHTLPWKLNSINSEHTGELTEHTRNAASNDVDKSWIKWLVVTSNRAIYI